LPLSHTDQLLYARLWEVLPDLARVPEAVEGAVAVLGDRSGVRFFDPCQYEKAIQTNLSLLPPPILQDCRWTNTSRFLFAGASVCVTVPASRTRPKTSAFKGSGAWQATYWGREFFLSG
jgi:hypothetical protein